MRLTLLHDIVRFEEKLLVKAARSRGYDVKLVDARNLILDPEDDLPEDLKGPVLQRCVSYYRNLHTTAYVEFKGGFIVNDLKTTLISGNKFLTTLALRSAGVPTPRTLFSFSKDGALEAFRALGGRAVLKPVMGSWGRLVALLETASAAKSVLEDREEMYPLYQIYYLQEYVDRPPRDIRAFVVGEDVVAAIYRYQPPGDWRTNTSRGGRAESCPVTKEIEDLAMKAAGAVGGGVLGVDMMEVDGDLVVHEVNHTTEFRNSVRVTGIDIPGRIVEYAVDGSRR